MRSTSPAAWSAFHFGRRGSGPATRGVGRRPGRSIALRPDNEARLYGALLEDVLLLRRRGFGVHREGRLLRVGNRLMSARALKRVAARERRLMTNRN